MFNSNHFEFKNTKTLIYLNFCLLNIFSTKLTLKCCQGLKKKQPKTWGSLGGEWTARKTRQRKSHPVSTIWLLHMCIHYPCQKWASLWAQAANKTILNRYRRIYNLVAIKYWVGQNISGNSNVWGPGELLFRNSNKQQPWALSPLRKSLTHKWRWETIIVTSCQSIVNTDI